MSGPASRPGNPSRRPRTATGSPEVFPPFTGAPIAGGDGNLWLRRPVSMNYLNYRYDVVDRRGQLIGVLSLAKGERIVTVGKAAVYVA